MPLDVVEYFVVGVSVKYRRCSRFCKYRPFDKKLLTCDHQTEKTWGVLYLYFEIAEN